MRTTASTTDSRATQRSRHLLSPLRFVRDLRFVLVVVLGLLVSTLAYQAPASGSVRIGWLGDRLFLRADGGLSNTTSFYADDLTDSPTSRSRWTRQAALIILPSLGAGTTLDITLLAQGWPSDVVGRPATQPNVRVVADGAPIGEFTPTAEWDSHTFRIPAAARTSADLRIELQSSDTFTDTLRGSDPRPKGVRLAQISITSAGEPQLLGILPPAWPMTAQLVLTVLLAYLLLLRLGSGETLAFVLTTFLAGALGVALAVFRVWTAALLGVSIFGVAFFTPLVALLGVALVLSYRQWLLNLVRALLLRYGQGRALGYGLVSAALGWLGLALANWSLTFHAPGTGLFYATFPDSLLYGLLGMGLLALALVRGREGLPRLANSLVDALDKPRTALALLILFGGIWLSYETWIVLGLPYVGHADYADNAVVARNLLAGRGWVVDYVTQFYTLYNGLTHPQETWPLLQPVFIAASFAVFGVHDWAAKVPNLVFNLALLVLIYRVGTYVWDRRVGLTAAVLTLTNYLFFRLTIYSTSDLAFVLFALGAVYALYRAERGRRETRDARREAGDRREGTALKTENSKFKIRSYLSLIIRHSSLDPDHRPPTTDHRFSPRVYLLLSGLLAGLMILQKPSSAIIAAGMCLWVLDFRWEMSRNTPFKRARLISNIRQLVIWGLVILVVISPYVGRNLALCRAPVCSTERYDAWVLGYRGDTDEAWSDIYKLYDPQLGGLGLPDRSWVLRWGFDLSLDKFERQVAATRDYLLPPWLGLPDSLGALFGRPDKQQLLGPMGAWLALAGLVAALYSRRRLIALLSLCFGPYILFLAVYWHTNEERYFVPLIPWLALFAAWAVWSGYKRLAAIGDKRWAPLGLALALVVLFGVVQPSWGDIADKVQNEPALWTPDLAAYAWLRDNTPADAAVMTRTPWQLNWHAERSALMIPNTADRAMILQLAHHYHVEYIAFETLQRVKGDAQAALAPLINARDDQPGAVIDGFTLVYASPTPDNRVLIYRIPDQ